MDNKLRRQARVLPGLAATLVLLTATTVWADFERSFTIESNELRLANLIGTVDVKVAKGDKFLVTVHVQGEDATEERVQFEESGGRRGELAILFPTDESSRYVYPPMGRNSRTKFSSKHHDSSLGQLLGLGRHKIEVRGRSWKGALEVWADVVVEVPEGKRLSVYLGVGAMAAADIKGDLELDAQSGSIDTENTTGQLSLDTGSGRISVRGVNGDVNVDTGSGRVEVSDVENASYVNIDTGSGSVVVERVQADRLSVDTGSGSVDVDVANVEEVSIDTGSGAVEAYEIASDNVSIDTGSGGVRLELVRMGRGRYDIDTGSGSIRVHLPRQISASFQADTGSGDISVDIEGIELTRRERRDGEARFTIGDGDSRFRLSTGSGTIRIVQAHNG